MRRERRTNLIRMKPGRQEASRTAATVPALMIIREALRLRPEAARPSSMPRPAAKATRIRGGRVRIPDWDPEDLIPPAEEPPSSMRKQAAKVTKIAKFLRFGRRQKPPPGSLLFG